MSDRAQNLRRRWRGLVSTAALGVLTCQAAAAGEGLVERMTYGTSSQGRPLEMVRVTSDDARPIGQKPGVLVVAGLDGRHIGGIEVAARIARSLADHPELPRDTDFFVIAEANPDAAARFRAGALDRGGMLDPIDEDRDRRVDEDGPIDLNGDGVITQMRVANPSIASGLTPTHVIDPDEPRLIRRADSSKGERAVYAVLAESRDQDGDGRFGEDPVGHTVLDRSFPYLWPEGEADAARYPLVHRETHALADWLLENPHIVAVVSIGAGDDLRTLPDVGKMDQTGRVPTGIERGDKAAWETVADLFKHTTTLGKAPTPDREGSLHGWAYGHLGLYAWMLPVQGLRDSEPASAAKQEEQPAGQDEAQEAEADASPDTSVERRNELVARGVPAEIASFMVASPGERSEMIATLQAAPQDEQARMQEMVMSLPNDIRTELMAMISNRAQEIEPESDPEPAREAPRRSGTLSDDQKWLALADDRGNGYVDWTPFDHPQLGRVEIGGFVPGFMLNPHPDRYDTIAEEHAKFLVKLASVLPRLRVDRPEIEQTSRGVWRVRLRVSNQGELASTTAMLPKARRKPSLALVMELGADRVLVGNRRQSLGRIDGGGGSASAEWVVLANAGEVVRVTMSDPQLGDTPIEIELTEVQR